MLPIIQCHVTLDASHSVVYFRCLQDSGMYVNDLVKPVLTCFYDSDSRVRYYGCEALYNIVKVARSAVLPYFNDIFDGLGKVRTAFCI